MSGQDELREALDHIFDVAQSMSIRVSVPAHSQELEDLAEFVAKFGLTVADALAAEREAEHERCVRVLERLRDAEQVDHGGYGTYNQSARQLRLRPPARFVSEDSLEVAREAIRNLGAEPITDTYLDSVDRQGQPNG